MDSVDITGAFPAAASPPPLTREALLHLVAGLAERVHGIGDDDTGLRALAGLFAEECRAVAHPPDTAVLSTADSLMDPLLADYAARQAAAAANGGVVGVRTGLGHLDETLNGLEPGKLYVLAAAPGAGKTTLCTQWAGTVAQAGRPALLVSLENDAVDIGRKLACRLGGVSYSRALKGRLEPEEWERAVHSLRALGGRLFIAAPRATMPDLAALIEAIMMRAGAAPALVVIDYLQAWVKRAATAVEASDVRERIDRFTPYLRGLGERYGCAIVAISSQNRSGYAAGGQTSLKESGDIEYGADAVLTLARWEEKDAVLGPGDTSVMLKLTVEKNRSGMTGRPMALRMNGDRCTIAEVVPEIGR